MDLVQQGATGGTFWQDLFVDALLAWAFHEIADFKIVTKLKCFFCHCHIIFERIAYSGIVSISREKFHYHKFLPCSSEIHPQARFKKCLYSTILA